MILTPSPPGHTIVHVWLASLCCSDEERKPLWDILSDDEQDRACRFHFSEHRHAFVVARAKTRAILSRYVPEPAGRIRFATCRNGKPALANGGPEFNVSHSGSMLACAVTCEVPVGIDIEQIRPIEAGTLVKRFFAPEEQTEVLYNNTEIVERFFRCWTRKEAFLKATGDGLSRALDSFAVSAHSDENARLVRIDDVDDKDLWRILPIRLPGPYKGAVAVRACVDQLRVFDADRDFHDFCI